jgi:hypothetical protein
LEIANTVEAVQDGKIYIELINGPFLFRDKARRPNTRPAWTWRLNAAGWRCTRAVPLSRPPRQELICLPEPTSSGIKLAGEHASF